MINLVVPVYNEEDRFVASYWGDIIAIPNVRVLFVNVSVLASVARVPVVGSVMFVLAVEARVVANAPDVVRSPPKVMVLLPLLTPVPP